MISKIKFIGDGTLWCKVAPEQTYERWRHILNGSFALDKNYYRGEISSLRKVSFFDLSKRLNINYTCYYMIGESKYSALFAQIGYFGSDDYNIYFNESYFNLRTGIAFAFFNHPID